MINIGLVREGKQPADKRVPLLPEQCLQLQKQYSNVQIFVQPSLSRCVPDEHYQRVGIAVQENLEHCHFLFGVKEVPITMLIPEKTYFFFSHTIKKQAYNRKLLQEILAKKITLIDYERLLDAENQRVVAFGRFAGIVGAYNALRAYGLKHNLYQLDPAHQCQNYQDLQKEYSKIQLPPLKIALTSKGGKVGKGAAEVLQGSGIMEVSPQNFLEKEFTTPVFVRLSSREYYQPKIPLTHWTQEYFYQNPLEFESTFAQYLAKSHILIATHFWNGKAAALFRKEELKNEAQELSVIADISCDINGSIPTTLRSSTIENPFYDYHRQSSSEQEAFSNPTNITVMAVDNLPCELPLDASKSFGEQLIKEVFPALLQDKYSTMLSKATITQKGELTPEYQYLQAFVQES